MWTGVPLMQMATEESERLLHMEEELKKHIIGQDDAIDSISKAVRRARAGLKDPRRPIGSFIFIGPSGVGKTELAKTLAEHDDVDAIWYAGPPEGQAMVQRASAGNMKRTWVLPASGPLPHADEILREATQVKNIWVPYGA